MIAKLSGAHYFSAIAKVGFSEQGTQGVVTYVFHVEAFVTKMESSDQSVCCSLSGFYKNCCKLRVHITHVSMPTDQLLTSILRT